MATPRSSRHAAPFARVFSLAALLLALAPLPARTQQPEYQVSAAADPCARVRAGANDDAEVLDCAAPGTRLVGLENAPFWRQVRLPDGREGWVARKYLEMAAPPQPADSVGEIPRDAWLQVHFVDVGQGDGIWIHTPDDGIDGNGVFEGRNVVIDGGPFASSGDEAFWRYLAEHGHEGAVIDAVVITHPHSDHWRGSAGVLDHFEVASLYDSGFPKGGTYAQFLDRARRSTARGQPTRVMVGRASFGALDWGKELQVKVLHAYPENPQGLGRDNTLENNASIVLRLQYGEVSFLLMGDAEGKDRGSSPDEPLYVERELLQSVPHEELRSTVIKLAHHGSETSSTTPFLDAVQPRIVVIQSGRKSYSGTFIPDPSTLRRLCDRLDVQIYRTDYKDEEEGRTESNDADADHVVIATNGRDVEVRAYSNGTLLAPPQPC